jgi:hypothetical protein
LFCELIDRRDPFCEHGSIINEKVIWNVFNFGCSRSDRAKPEFPVLSKPLSKNIGHSGLRNDELLGIPFQISVPPSPPPFL